MKQLLIIFLILLIIVQGASANTTVNQGTGYLELNQIINDYLMYLRADGNAIDDNLTYNGTFGILSNASMVGKYKNAFGFRGIANSNITINGNIDSVLGSENTVSLWFNKSNETLTEDTDFIEFLYNTSDRLIIQLNPNTTTRASYLAVYDDIDNRGVSLENTTIFVNDSIWHNLIFTCGASGKNLYLDNVSVMTDADTSCMNSITSPYTVKLGTRNYTALIDDIYIFNRVLFPQERGQVMAQSKYSSGNFTSWYNQSDGNVTNSIIINATTPTNTNYTVWYRQNNTGNFVQLGGTTFTGNLTINEFSPSYQNTDVRVVLNGNGTATPELIQITYVGEAEETSTEFMPDTPISCTSTVGTTWMNASCSAAGTNITNSMNKSLNGQWDNTSVTYINITGLSEGTLYEARFYAYNSSGTGSLNLTYASISNTTLIPEQLPGAIISSRQIPRKIYSRIP